MGSLKRKHLDLFSGIGGFALAARWAGIETIGFCEIDKYAQKVLQKNFPGVPIYEDVTKLNGSEFKDIYLLTGGFPCQDISIAGKGAGIEGERSGLWSELFRIIGEVRPKYALIENVPALTFRGGTRVIGDLTEIGYDTEWQIVGADDVGAPHKRKRIWIVAYPKCNSQRTTHRSDSGIGGRGWNEQSISEGDQVWCNSGDSSENVAHSNPGLSEGENQEIFTRRDSVDNGSKDVADSMCINRGSREKPRQPKRNSSRKPACYSREDVADSNSKRQQGQGKFESTFQFIDGGRQEFWLPEPDVGRVAHGIPNRMDRLKGLGNAIVPQVAYEIIRCLK